jgi:hypothetical protein
MGVKMLSLLGSAEFASCMAEVSAIVWLRRLAGQPVRGLARHFVASVAALVYAITLLVAIIWAVTQQQPESSVTVSWVLGCGLVLAALLVRLFIAARQFRTCAHGIS